MDNVKALEFLKKINPEYSKSFGYIDKLTKQDALTKALIFATRRSRRALIQEHQWTLDLEKESVEIFGNELAIDYRINSLFDYK